MPSPLTREQTTEMSDRLMARRTELRHIIKDELARGETQAHADLANQVHDAEDEALADLLADSQLTAIDRHVDEMRRIEGSLRRIAAGAYGRCTDCGRPVGIERLRAWPTAERCIDCQTLYERTHASDEHSTL